MGNLNFEKLNKILDAINTATSPFSEKMDSLLSRSKVISTSISEIEKEYHNLRSYEKDFLSDKGIHTPSDFSKFAYDWFFECYYPSDPLYEIRNEGIQLYHLNLYNEYKELKLRGAWTDEDETKRLEDWKKTNKHAFQQSVKEATDPPKRNPIDREKLEGLLKQKFCSQKGEHTSQKTKLDRLIEDLNEEYYEYEFAQIAMMMFEGDILWIKRVKWSRWYEDFCKAVGIEVSSYRDSPKKVRKPNERISRTFCYLNLEEITPE